jgi:hypothetical protein
MSRDPRDLRPLVRLYTTPYRSSAGPSFTVRGMSGRFRLAGVTLQCALRSSPPVVSRSGQTWSVGMIQSSLIEAWCGRVTM